MYQIQIFADYIAIKVVFCAKKKQSHQMDLLVINVIKIIIWTLQNPCFLFFTILGMFRKKNPRDLSIIKMFQKQQINPELQNSNVIVAPFYQIAKYCIIDKCDSLISQTVNFIIQFQVKILINIFLMKLIFQIISISSILITQIMQEHKNFRQQFLFKTMIFFKALQGFKKLREFMKMSICILKLTFTPSRHRLFIVPIVITNFLIRKYQKAQGF
ncbi:unnamed protein product [Paramecium sonneborni]|uniref:Transmembrane protein n=1 Tax=Paramecium sonneborni TaxID=65129 RepID=A0A8S1R0J3_9CILI|nr:unnamed protein product [Paramecium sonneborni]